MWASVQHDDDGVGNDDPHVRMMLGHHINIMVMVMVIVMILVTMVIIM